MPYPGLSETYTPPTFEALLAEQEVVQAEKFQARMLQSYNSLIFPGICSWKPQPSAVSDFLITSCGAGPISLESLVEGMSGKLDRPAHWVDMGAGKKLAQREFASTHAGSLAVRLTSVDLFDYGFDDLDEDDAEYLRSFYPTILNDEFAPHFVQDNVETVQLEEPADLTTAIETVQYLHDPLRALTNWYNQTSNGGFVVIANAHDWSEWVRYADASIVYDPDTAVMKYICDELTAKGVPYAGTYEADWENGTRPTFEPGRMKSFVLQKAAGTALELRSDVAGVWTNPKSYKAVYYEQPETPSSIIEVVRR